MSAAITVTYELHPPPDTLTTGLLSTKTHQFPVADGVQSGKEYYEALRRAVADAKSTLGDELTAWRDAVGTREQEKEKKLPAKIEEDDEEEEEPEE
ncbi:hypothetical protein BKA93DRAFT_55150 [Sparassis latifolia]